MPRISITVPIYNVEKYLSKCVDSILHQTFTDFELILVDDGSTDNSGVVCDKYSEKDSRVKVIHKENGGSSSARNAGIDIATAEYLGFVDADDYIEKDMYEILYKDICESGADISICGIYDKYDNRCCINKNAIKKCVLNSKEAFKLVLESRAVTANAVNKLYKKKLFNNRRFPVGKFYEDALLVPELIINSDKVCYNPAHKYYYVRRKNSKTTSEFNIKNLELIDAYTENLIFVKNNYPDLENQAMFRYIWSYIFVFDKMCMAKNFQNTEIYNSIIKKIKENIFFIVKSPLFSIKRKLATIILFINPKLYKRYCLGLNKNF